MIPIRMVKTHTTNKDKVCIEFHANLGGSNMLVTTHLHPDEVPDYIFTVHKVFNEIADSYYPTQTKRRPHGTA